MSKNGPYPKGVNGSNYGFIDQQIIDKQQSKSFKLVQLRSQNYSDTLNRIEKMKQKHELTNSQEVPVINVELERRNSIISNTPAIFEITENPVADASEPIHEIDFFDEVDGNEELYERVGREMGIDANFLKAIAYMETTHGYYDYLGALPGVRVTSFRPMNVRYDKWTDLANSLGYSSDDIENNVEANVRLGALILKRIWVRVQNPTIRKVASIYNFTGAEKVRDYGARVNDIYEKKQWLDN
ncbi:hypothetical protein [Vibrio sp. 1180_3]|uniref:hypothetical protein n=1 Tax=Vibrio sp. 1180_3 TaxID=2528832 RepID=UPI0024051FD2|nr:hypothetical protein [Vibrio sp. 1180_3]MDF9401601.1 hypothetical protein [Vibrio sp. 1180_3]